MAVVEGQVAKWMDRVRSEYIEMPSLSLTKRQMRRFWVIDTRICDAVVDALVASGFLRRRADHTYVRADHHL